MTSLVPINSSVWWRTPLTYFSKDLLQLRTIRHQQVDNSIKYILNELRIGHFMNIQNIFGGFSDLLTPAAGIGINITNLFIFENNEAAEGFLNIKKKTKE